MKEDKKNKSQDQNSELSNDDLESVAGGEGTRADGTYVDKNGKVWPSVTAWINGTVSDEPSEDEFHSPEYGLF